MRSDLLPGKKSNEFSQVRSEHSTEIAEDYVEAIAGIIEEFGVCRSIDLVRHFGVTHATVNNTVARLMRDRLVETAPYRPVTLTPRGKRMATASRKRHETVYQFLLKLGISADSAAVDSEGIEHHVSKETLLAMENVLSHGWPKSK